MATLLLRLAGPMQSWGTESRWEIRDAGREPSKSGVVGLLGAALGRSRSDPVSDLARLRMAVRVEREGIVKKDFQTAARVATASEHKLEDVISTRYYLSDAEFLVGLEGPEALLGDLAAQLGAPVYPLYLGRRSYPPSAPVRLPHGLYPSLGLSEVLRQRPWEPTVGNGRRPDRLRVVEEAAPGEGDSVRRDQPLGECFASREFGLRHLVTYFVPPPGSAPA